MVKKNPISIELIFDSNLNAKLPDGYVKQDIGYDKVLLKIKFRERKASEKAFSDLFVIEHRVEPISSTPKAQTGTGWEITRKSGSKFKFTEQLLSLNIIETDDLPRSFLF
jgi:hypothetical protein